jgi:hypothetical protein
MTYINGKNTIRVTSMSAKIQTNCHNAYVSHSVLQRISQIFTFDSLFGFLALLEVTLMIIATEVETCW